LVLVGALDSLCLLALGMLLIVPGRGASGMPEGIPFLLFGFGVMGLVILGLGIVLMERPSTRLGKAAGVLALLPLHPAMILGIPVGIWTLSRVRRIQEQPARPPSRGSGLRKAPVPGSSAVAGESAL
jgi:hypothetical protein